MGVIPKLHSDIAKLNRLYVPASVSMKRRIVNDYEYAYSLAEELGINLDIPKYKVSIKEPELFFNQVDTYIYDMEHIADIVIGMFKQMNFCFFKRYHNEYVSKRDMELLMKEFLDYFLSDLYYIYRDLIKDDRLVVTNLGSNLGESFFLNQLDSYYFALSDKNRNSMLMFETIVHELVHIYSFMFMKNYRYKGIDNLNNGFFGETLSLYSELSLYEFLKSKGIFGDGIDFQRNLVDYYILCYFKTVKYLGEMARRPDTSLSTNNVDYEVFGNNRLIVDDDLGMFSYPESYSKGSILDCRYAMSSIDAFRLLEREKNGEYPSKLINEYLIGCQYENQMDTFLSEYIDLDFMYETIDSRNKALQKKYLYKSN